MNDRNQALRAALKKLANGRMSKRHFMTLALSLGLAPSGAEYLIGTAQAAVPRRGGRFRLAVAEGAATDTLDPSTYLNVFAGTAFWGTLSNGLTEMDANGDVVGDIAESFEPSDNARKWVFKLRNGVTFHDGRSVKTSDVLASINHHRGEDSTSPVKPVLQDVASVKADGQNSVIFELTNSNADFPYILSDYHLPIMPVKEDGTADWSSGNRTGAYKLNKLQPGVQANFVRNENYHKADRGWFDSVDILCIADSTARTNALMAGEIDYMDRCDLKVLSLLETYPNVSILETTGYGSYVFAMNVRAKPFDDPNVRMALKHSVDREDILNSVFYGHGTLGNDTPIAPTVKFSFDPLPHHTYNPTKAREYLKRAGIDKLTINLSVADAAFVGAVDCALIWREQAKACNIDINIVREPDDGYWTNVWRKKPFVATYWFGRPTIDWMMATAFTSNAVWNDTSWSNTQFDELLTLARTETDEDKRAAMYAEAQQILHDDGGLITLLFNSYISAHAENLAHGLVASNYQIDGMRIAERWWFES